MNYIQKLNYLSTAFDKNDTIQKLDEAQEKESYKLAYSLLEIEESIDEIKKNITLLLNHNTDNESINDILWDMGDEFYHILYHLKNSKFYSYILDRLK